MRIGGEPTRTIFARTPAPRERARLRLWAASGVVLLLGCPQMLEDDFDLRSEPISAPGDAGPTPGQGVGGAGGTHSDDGSSGAAGTEAGAPEEHVAVVSTVPADGARGVLPDSALVFLFAAPMDTGSVEAAYSSVNVPKNSVSFTWSDADRVLEIKPDTPLQAAAGADESAVTASEYSLGFSAQARDKLGRSLLPAQLSFAVARSITRSIKAVQDRDLTGNWRSDSSYGVADCERADTTICMGDGALTAQPDPEYRALLSFDLRPLPSDIIAVTDAELSLVVSSLYGEPFASLGTLHAEHVQFSSIGDAAFASAALSTRQLMSTDAGLGDRMSVGVLSDVQADLGARDYSQYRLAFDTASDEDDAPDHLICSWTTAQLDVTYWLP